VCMVCHGELVRLRPHPRYLTEFYLLISAGGALGGVFVSLVAPVIFTTFFEWPIGLALCCAIATAALGLAGRSGKLRLVRNLIVLPLAAAGLASIGVCEWQTSRVIDRARNFYGVVSVDDWGEVNDPNYEYVLQHGHIIHGRQFANFIKRQLATSYFSDESGVGRAICYYRERGNVRVGVVGLGVGTLAVYAQPGDYYQFYEINPEVKRMAEKYFTYLSDCRKRLGNAKRCRIVMGDARLSLENQKPQRFDVLVLDAFSGDSIPVHLLTREAFEIYQRHLAPNGVIAVHITNTYLYLAPVVRGLAEEFGLKTTRIYTEEDSDRLLNGADWMLLSKNQAMLDAIPPEPPDDVQDDFTVPLWTDQYSNLFQILQPIDNPISPSYDDSQPQDTSD